MKITNYNQIKKLEINIPEALQRFPLGLNDLNEKYADKQMENYGIAYDTELKSFVAVKGVTPNYKANEMDSIKNSKQKYYSLARIRDRHYKKLFAELRNNLENFALSKELTLTSLLEANGIGMADVFWTYIFDGVVKLKIADESFSFTKPQTFFSDAVTEFERWELGDKFIGRLNKKVVDLTKEHGYYVL